MVLWCRGILKSKTIGTHYTVPVLMGRQNVQFLVTVSAHRASDLNTKKVSVIELILHFCTEMLQMPDYMSKYLP